MQFPDRQWAIILAAGEGKRLESFRVGETERPIPKQFRSLDGQGSMLEWTIQRAVALVPMERIVCIVAEEHRCWWQSQLHDLPATNIVVQPSNKGTAAGILLPLFTVLKRDRLASVLILPSDHFVDDEKELGGALREAYRLARVNDRKVVLIGIEAGADVADYGWILPRTAADAAVTNGVLAFSEKPDPVTARRLQGQGALVNSLIMAATGMALLKLFTEAVPALVSQFFCQWLADDGGLSHTRQLYAELSPCDFSREVLERKPESLLVHPAPSSCGWIDLGTPARMSRFLDRYQASAA